MHPKFGLKFTRGASEEDLGSFPTATSVYDRVQAETHSARSPVFKSSIRNIQTLLGTATSSFRYPEHGDEFFSITIREPENQRHAQGAAEGAAQGAAQGAAEGEGKEDEDDERESVGESVKRMKFNRQLTCERGTKTFHFVTPIRLATEKMLLRTNADYTADVAIQEKAYIDFAARSSVLQLDEVQFDQFELYSSQIKLAKTTYLETIRKIHKHMLSDSPSQIPIMFNKAELIRMSPRQDLATAVVHFCSAWVLTHIDMTMLTPHDLSAIAENLSLALQWEDFKEEISLESMIHFYTQILKIRPELLVEADVVIPFELNMDDDLWDMLAKDGLNKDLSIQLVKTLKRGPWVKDHFAFMRDYNTLDQYVLDYGLHIESYKLLEIYFRPDEDKTCAFYEQVLGVFTLDPQNDPFVSVRTDYEIEKGSGRRS